MSTRGPLNHGQVAQLLCAVAPLVDRLHGAGLVHGHLIPDNVFVSRESPNQLIELSAALPRKDGCVSPPGWCAPELLESGASPTPTSDIYSLGLLTFFALTGHPAFAPSEPRGRADLREAQMAGLRGASARAATLGQTVDARLDRWFCRALEPNPKRRFQTASELALAFGRQLEMELSFSTVSKAFDLEPPAPDNPTRQDRADDDSIAAMSVQPLLFAGDLQVLTHQPHPDLPAHSQQPAPQPRGSRPSPQVGEAPGPPAEVPAPPALEPSPEVPSARPRRLVVVLALLTAAWLTGAALWFRAVRSEPTEPPAASLERAAAASPPRPSPKPDPVTPQQPEERPQEDGHPAVRPPDAAEPAQSATLAEVVFECSPVPCQSVFCNAHRHDPGAVHLSPGRHTCKGTAPGYGTAPVTLDLAAGQKATHRFQMTARPR